MPHVVDASDIISIAVWVRHQGRGVVACWAWVVVRAGKHAVLRTNCSGKIACGRQLMQGVPPINTDASIEDHASRYGSSLCSGTFDAIKLSLFRIPKSKDL
jgi:hypothetical protein